ncbi:MAG: hypothetical protein RKO24_05075 [Candidatus Competibacter sp.]|nr:hypothetical protein [Candidatus Competibacter sp.]
MDFKEINPLWRLADPLTVQQAAALIASFDPNAVRFNSNDAAWFENETGLTDSGGILWVQTAFAALVNAINARKLKAVIRRAAWERGWDEDPGEGERFESKVIVLEEDSLEAWQADPTFAQRRGIIYRVSPDWGLTTVAVADLRAWLEAAGIRTGFFFPAATDAPDYLDPKNPRYAPKLAAAVRAWRSVTDAGGKHPKQALAKWLREHAAEFGMTDDEGKPNETGIEEAAKVANWQPGGGAPKTPGE